MLMLITPVYAYLAVKYVQ